MAKKITTNRIHTPQIISSTLPENVSVRDFGTVWIDPKTNKFCIAITDKNGLEGVLTEVITTSNLELITDNFFTKIDDVYVKVLPQITGDKHFEEGYDFFTDEEFMKHASQQTMDYYSYFYVTVPDENVEGYLRTIRGENGKEYYIRKVNGYDAYKFNDQTYKLVRYSKIILPFKVKEIVEIKFNNKDVLESGFELTEDKKTILIYCDPEGLFINEKVKVRYLI